MQFEECLSKMKGPGDYRAGIWRGRVLQVKWVSGSVCDLSCKNCSVATGQLKKLGRKWLITPDQLRAALQSLKGFPGVIGAFGGNATLHPGFDDLCAVFREEIPNIDQRGLWSNRLFGKGRVCRETFSPIHSNLNVHGSQAAWDEIRRDWPEARPIPSSLSSPSMHGPIFGSMLDLGISEEAMWDSVSRCFVNQTWSAEITVIKGELRGYFCEIAATMAELEDDPSLGVSVVPGWWSRPMSDFRAQARTYCAKCLVSMNPKKIDAAGSESEAYTKTWQPTMMRIKGRPMMEAMSPDDLAGGAPATQYLPRHVMPAGFAG